VSNGTRTRDILDHNQVLYHLSYTHHGRSFYRPAEKKCTGSSRVLAPGLIETLARGSSPPHSSGSTYFAAIFFAVSESGPGCGTKTALR
jgi:hypothetical protein